ncbi:hypothetical protein FQZ97_1149960 [compost metagenome]
MLDGLPHEPDFIRGQRTRACDFFDLQVFLGVDVGKRVAGDELALYAPFEHLLGIDQDAVGDAGPDLGLRFKEGQPFVQGDLVRR